MLSMINLINDNNKFEVNLLLNELDCFFNIKKY